MATESLASQLQTKHAEMMRVELEAVALGLFLELGFGDVTVDRIAAAANTSPRTFYRYFPAKEDVLQVRIDVRTEALRSALLARPADEAPFQSIRVALGDVMRPDDDAVLRRWMDVIVATPSVLRGVLGGIQLKSHQVYAELFGRRLGVPSDELVPTMLAAAVGGVIQAAHTRWYLQGGDLRTAIGDGLGVLERGLGSDPVIWAVTPPSD